MDPSISGFFKNLSTDFSLHDASIMVPRLLVAVTIGTALALRPWRLLMRRTLPKAEMMQAQVLLCAAAAVITAVIGDSMAKAFGLVGLGGFVRFRSGLKDPRDAAILFLMIGLGMACGHGSLGLAAVGSLFVAGLLLVLDLLDRKEPAPVKQRMLVSAQADDLAGAEAWLRQTLTERNVLVRSCALDFDGRRLELEVEEKEPGQVASTLGRTAGAPLRGVRWAELSSSKSNREEQT
jgi:predicted membrane-bound mannosyltransferase